MSALNQLRAQALARWQALSTREQRGLCVLGALLGVWLFWAIAIDPARHTLRDSAHRRKQIEQQHAQMLALQNQAQALKSRTPLSRDEALRHLQSLTPSTQIQLTVQGERVSVQLKAVPAPTLADWLTQARSQAQVLPTEAHLTRNTATGAADVVWNGTLVLTLPHRGPTP